MVSYAIERTRPGWAASQTAMAPTATASSTTMPAAPIIARRHLSGTTAAAEASTYGAGMKVRIMMPSSCTSWPASLTA